MKTCLVSAVYPLHFESFIKNLLEEYCPNVMRLMQDDFFYSRPHFLGQWFIAPNDDRLIAVAKINYETPNNLPIWHFIHNSDSRTTLTFISTKTIWGIQKTFNTYNYSQISSRSTYTSSLQSTEFNWRKQKNNTFKCFCFFAAVKQTNSNYSIIIAIQTAQYATKKCT